ncbi:MAG TPA: EamA family transporter, partial [Phytomonospora sp.]
MGELLALTSALCFGTAHFLNALVAKRGHHGVVVAAYAQTAGTVVSAATAFAVPGAADAESLAWGALSGIGTGVGVGCLYWSMNRGPLSGVVPVSDVAADAGPVLAGLALLGERPSVGALAGVAVAIPAIVLVSRGRERD